MGRWEPREGSHSRDDRGEWECPNPSTTSGQTSLPQNRSVPKGLEQSRRLAWPASPPWSHTTECAWKGAREALTPGAAAGVQSPGALRHEFI